jgi:hypothetical protein
MHNLLMLSSVLKIVLKELKILRVYKSLVFILYLLRLNHPEVSFIHTKKWLRTVWCLFMFHEIKS